MTNPDRNKSSFTPLTASPDLDLVTALKILRDNNVHHLIVCDDGRVVGVTSDRDIVEGLLTVSGGAGNQNIVRVESGRTIRNVMRTEFPEAGPDASLAFVVETMRNLKLSGLPIVSRGEPVGIITEADLLHALEVYLQPKENKLSESAYAFLQKPWIQNLMKLLADVGI